MKKTWKLRAAGNIAETMAGAPSVAEAARRLGVARETLSRAIAAGRVPPPGRPRQRQAAGALPSDPAGWAAGVRERYDLTGTEGVLVDLAERALALACDDSAAPMVRLAATARFQKLVDQLDLEVEADGETETRHTNLRTWPRPA